MNDYIKVTFTLTPGNTDACDLLADALGEAGYESFTSNEEGSELEAFVRAETYDPEVPEAVCREFIMPGIALDFTSEKIEGRNWNEEWEKNYFQPIVIADQCVIHSTFHKDVPQARMDIVIDPKMAFGTGHHATTSQVATALLGMDLKDLEIIDMGTGTGILTIIAALGGARHITAIEIDEFAYTNAVENFGLNSVADSVTALLGDASMLPDTPVADVFIANINRNVILGDIARYAAATRLGGVMLLSGFYVEDIPMILEAAEACGMVYDGYTEQDHWSCVRLVKNPNYVPES